MTEPDKKEKEKDRLSELTIFLGTLTAFIIVSVLALIIYLRR